MNFFAHQEAARRRTGLLLFYYSLAVASITLLVYGAAMVAFGAQQGKGKGRSGGAELTLWHPKVFAASTLGTLAVILAGAGWRMAALGSGGRGVAEMLGGRPVPPDPADESERRLRNVIEEMALASGTPVPEIYLLEHEPGINAFAAGHSTGDMAIGVTRGCMEKLNRDELQGVMAHEFSHILNGDMRLNIRLIGVLHGILCLYLVGRVLLEMRGRSSKDKNPLPLFGLALMAIGGVGLLFAHLIQAAVSRQREFLADASAVQFTRNPGGIAGALKKIGGWASGSKLESPNATAASHLFFGNGLSESWFGLTATHPPLDERIRRIDPEFDGQFPEVGDAPAARRTAGPPHVAPPPLSASAFAQLRPTPPRISPARMMASVGGTATVRYAAGMLETLPGPLLAAARDPLSATGLVFAMVLSHAPEVRERQMVQLQAYHAAVADETERLAGELARAERGARLPLVSLALPALRTLSHGQWRRYSAALDELAAADGETDLFEFVLKKIVARNLDAYWEPMKGAVIQFYSFGPLAPDCSVLLSALANCGGGDAGLCAEAFQRGMAKLPFATGLARIPASDCGVAELDAALTRLGQAVPHIKQRVLEACAECVAADGSINHHEAELLRGVAETLECPMPPRIEGV